MIIDRFGIAAIRNAWHDSSQITDHVLYGYTKVIYLYICLLSFSFPFFFFFFFFVLVQSFLHFGMKELHFDY